jgi:hypothetical protein
VKNRDEDKSTSVNASGNQLMAGPGATAQAASVQPVGQTGQRPVRGARNIHNNSNSEQSRSGSSESSGLDSHELNCDPQVASVLFRYFIFMV